MCSDLCTSMYIQSHFDNYINTKMAKSSFIYTKSYHCLEIKEEEFESKQKMCLSVEFHFYV